MYVCVNSEHKSLELRDVICCTEKPTPKCTTLSQKWTTLSALITMTHFWQTCTTGNMQKYALTAHAFCITALPRKILIAILVVFFNAEKVTVLFGQYLRPFSFKIHNFQKNHTS